LKDYLQAEDSSVVEEALIQLYECCVQKGKIQEERQSSSLTEALSREGLLKRRFNCTKNSLSNIQEELIIEAENEEDAWEQMAARFPVEMKQGFNIKEISPFNFLN